MPDTSSTRSPYRRFRRLNRLWAALCGYYWRPCPLCHRMYGGHEAGAATFRIPARPHLPGLRDAEADVDVFPFSRDRVLMTCWRHPVEASSDWSRKVGALVTPTRDRGGDAT